MFIKFFKKNWLPLFTTSMIFVIWELGIQIFGVPEYIAPAPSSVFATLVGTRHVVAQFSTNFVREPSRFCGW